VGISQIYVNALRKSCWMR